MLQFKIMFYNLLNLFELGGIWVPLQPDISLISLNVLKKYSFLTVIFLTSNLLLVLYLALHEWESVKDLSMCGSVISVLSYNLFITIYIYFQRNNLELLIQRLDL